MKRLWQAAFVGLVAAIVVTLYLIRATPANGLILIHSGESSPLLFWLADILLLVACIVAGGAALVGLCFAVWACWEKGFGRGA